MPKRIFDKAIFENVAKAATAQAAQEVEHRLGFRPVGAFACKFEGAKDGTIMRDTPVDFDGSSNSTKAIHAFGEAYL